MKKIIAGIACVLFGAAIGFAPTALASHGNDDAIVRYDRVSGNHPTIAQKISIKGAGCMNAEDSFVLEFLDYDSADGRVTYHCLKP